MLPAYGDMPDVAKVANKDMVANTDEEDYIMDAVARETELYMQINT